MPFILSDDDALHTSVMAEQPLSRSIINRFQQILIKFAHFILLAVCVVLGLLITFNFNQFSLAAPIFLLVYSFIIHVAYACLMVNKFDKVSTSWCIEPGNDIIHSLHQICG